MQTAARIRRVRILHTGVAYTVVSPLLSRTGRADSGASLVGFVVRVGVD